MKASFFEKGIQKPNVIIEITIRGFRGLRKNEALLTRECFFLGDENNIYILLKIQF